MNTHRNASTFRASRATPVVKATSAFARAERFGGMRPLPAAAATLAPRATFRAPRDFALRVYSAESTTAEMEDEELDPLLSKVDALFTGADALAADVDELFDDDDEDDEEDYDDDDEDEPAAAKNSDPNHIDNFPISVLTKAALRKRGIESLFPIQSAVLAPALEGRDIVGRARTGTGKTLGFSLPIIESLLSNPSDARNRRPRCIVLAPTRELANQVEAEIQLTVPSMRTVCVYGGVAITNQERALRNGVDFVVGTPGRLIDLIQRGSLQLQDIEYCVLDEADQMLAVGFEEDVERIMQEIPEERQTFLFSATMPSWVKQLTRKYLKEHVNIDLVGDSKQKVADTIDILSCACSHQSRTMILADLVTVYGKGAKAICFTQTKREADEVTAALGRRMATEVLHGDIAQAQRERTLKRFRDNRFSVLVATDVAARFRHHRRRPRRALRAPERHGVFRAPLRTHRPREQARDRDRDVHPAGELPPPDDRARDWGDVQIDQRADARGGDDVVRGAGEARDVARGRRAPSVLHPDRGGDP